MHRYWKQLKATVLAIEGLCRPHRLKLPRKQLEFESSYSLKNTEIRSWVAFFARHSPDPQRPAGDFPFFYFEPAAATAFHRILSALGPNLRNVLNLETSYRIRPDFGAGTVQPGVYRLRSRLIDLFEQTDARRCIVKVQCGVYDAGSAEPAITVISTFAIRHVPEKDLLRLRSIPRIGPAGRDFELSSKPRPELGKAPEAESEKLYRSTMLISSRMGLEYGILAGDMNLAHISQRLCRLFGLSRPFLQGFCVANYAIYKLGKREKGGLHEFTIHYCLPTVLDQTIELRYDGRRFEVIDAKGRVLARGKYGQLAGAGAGTGVKVG